MPAWNSGLSGLYGRSFVAFFSYFGADGGDWGIPFAWVAGVYRFGGACFVDDPLFTQFFAKPCVHGHGWWGDGVPGGGSVCAAASARACCDERCARG